MKFLLVSVLALAVVQGRPEHHNRKTITYDTDVIISAQEIIDEHENVQYYPTPYIYGGTEGKRGQFPYQAALYLNGRSFCGGSLISTRWVLTAAHCASGIDTFIVYLGAHNLNAANEEGREIVQTGKKIVHSGYSSLTLTNDIALIDLQKNIQLSNYIQPIPLASGSSLYSGETARVSGWGRTSSVSASISPVLRYADIKIISNTICSQIYNIIIPASAICAQGTNGASVCNGDNGGPLVDLNTGKQIGLVGYISLADCGSRNLNNFIRISSFASWISANTGINI